MAMIDDRSGPALVASPCPAWLAAIPAATLRRLVVAGCALSWVAIVVMIVT